jgi:hypothetical protein
MTGFMAPESAVIDRQTETFYCPVFGVSPEGYDAVRDAEKVALALRKSQRARSGTQKTLSSV